MDQSPPDELGIPGRRVTDLPVFTDPSGQRRRLLRVAGAAASVLLVGGLVLVGIGLFGGPQTPFKLWGAPPPALRSPSSTPSGGHGSHRGSGGTYLPGPGHSGTQSPAPRPGNSPSPSPKPSATRGSPTSSSSPSGSPTSSPTPSASHTPPGQTRSPNPHPSPSSTHAH